MKYKILPIFIPHEGCPHQCIFCDQKTIVGTHFKISIKEIPDKIERFASTKIQYSTSNIWKEVAFYGGSFTAVSGQLQESLLKPAYQALRRKKIQGIRISTRPDYCDSSALELLKDYGVQTVELGVQSMDAEVLRLTGRGHGPEESTHAIGNIKSKGFSTGVQLMPGLPGEDQYSFFSTVNTIIALKPDFVRLYPTLVLKGTPLEKLYLKGAYKPLSLVKAIELCSRGMSLFWDSGIKVIRCGLQPTPSLEKRGNICAGPFHSAFGELVESAIIFDLVESGLREFLKSAELKKNLFIKSAKKVFSKLKGQKGINLHRLKMLYPDFKITLVPDPFVPLNYIKIIDEDGRDFNILVPFRS